MIFYQKMLYDLEMFLSLVKLKLLKEFLKIKIFYTIFLNKKNQIIFH